MGTVVYMSVIFAVAGAVPGGLLGGIVGGLVGLITMTSFTRTPRPKLYKRVISVVVGVVTFFGALFAYWAIGSFYSVTGSANPAFVIFLAILATLVALYASRRVTQWYLERNSSLSESSLRS